METITIKRKDSNCELSTPSHVQYTFDDVIEAYADNDPLENVFEAMPNVLYPYIEEADKHIAKEYNKAKENYSIYF
ncbi:putative uncharacterized protein [Staphylococcus equorum subsp. equorum Mu2]|uniref:hypothetical protein n=1 Tax=Staphylococcus equorum TaxID=246432 RepID=UPI000267DE9F|nr:hypothetical protein [Staphylococcus equorum]CCI60780.1 putative uncharacterized protein [Staphylococcus equorum subsp. equorum Mu2]